MRALRRRYGRSSSEPWWVVGFAGPSILHKDFRSKTYVGPFANREEAVVAGKILKKEDRSIQAVFQLPVTPFDSRYRDDPWLGYWGNLRRPEAVTARVRTKTQHLI